MWPEHARGVRQRWRGFADRLGERVVVESLNGVRSEGLVLAAPLAGSDGVATFAELVDQESDLTHQALRVFREVQRTQGARGIVPVSDYLAGPRLSSWLVDRAGEPPATGTVLYIAREAAGALCALDARLPGFCHGALGLERIVLGPQGRVCLVEPRLGALLSRLPVQGAADWWQRYRIAVPFTTAAAPFGPGTDACQLGLLVLQLLLGRSLDDDEYPDQVGVLLGEAEETDLLGEGSPLGAGLFEWLTLALGLDPDHPLPKVSEVGEALDRLLSDEGAYVAVPLDLDVRSEPLVPWPFEVAESPPAWASSPDSREGQAEPIAEPVPAGLLIPLEAVPASRGWRPTWRVRTPDPPLHEHDLPASSSVTAGSGGAVAFDEVDRASLPAVPAERLPESDVVPTPQRSRAVAVAVPRRAEPIRRPVAAGIVLPDPDRRAWRPAVLRWGLACIGLALVMALSWAGWLSWRERHIQVGTGNLELDSTPPGATVLVDGLERGKAPLAIAVVPGRHEILVKSAQGSGRTTVDLAVGATRRVVVPLQLGTDPAQLDIATEPAGAEVTMDGAPQGRTPLSLAGVLPGEHLLAVEKGPVRVERRLTVAPGETLTLVVPLAGWLDVRARVPLEVLDRATRLGSSDAGRLLAPAGRRRLRFVNDDFGVDTSQDVVVGAGQVVSVAVPLTAGVLSVRSDPPADVSVDGQHYGRTPTPSLSVPIGQHEVLLRHPRWGEQRLTVIVGLGAPTRLSVNLRK